jgi:hypothetical protein
LFQTRETPQGLAFWRIVKLKTSKMSHSRPLQ